MKQVKFLILAFVMPFLLGVTACNPEEEVKQPTVTLTAGEASATSITFTATTENATQAAWMVVPASETAPTADDVLANGRSLQVNKAETITVPNLNPSTAYTVAVVAVGEKNTTNAFKTIEMSTSAQEGFSFQLQITMDEITHNSASFVVTTTDQEADYYLTVVPAAELEGKDDDTVFRGIIANAETAATEAGLTIFEWMQEEGLIFRGNQENEFTDLTPETAYVVMAFGINADNARTSDIVREGFETLEHIYPLVIDVTLGEPTANTVPVTVNVNDANLAYYITAVNAASVADYTDDEIFEAYMAEWGMYAEEYGMSIYELLLQSNMLYKGGIEGNFTQLLAETEYTTIAFGLGSDDTRISEMVRVDFKTRAVEQTGLTFTFDVTNVTETSAHVVVTPSDMSAKFIWLCQPMNDPNWTAETIMNDYVNQWQGFLNSGWGTYTGVQDYTISLMAGTTYYLIAWGYDGGITSEPQMITFETLAGADMSEFDCEFEVINLDAHNVDLAVTPNYNSIYYLFGATPDDQVDMPTLLSEIELMIEDAYLQSVAFNPQTTIADVVDQMCYNGYSRGVISDLTEMTSYSVFAIPIGTDGKCGENYKLINGFFTTPAFRISDATLTNQVHKVFDGTESQNAGLFGGAETSGRAILTASFEASSDAYKLFYGISDGDITDVEEYPNEYLWKNAVWYEIEGGLEANPYQYFLTDWSYTYTIISYATDAAGYRGVVDRTLVTVKKENISPIEELIEMIEASSAPARYCVAPEEEEAAFEFVPTQENKVEMTIKGLAR